jgi:hypothetical protein
MRLIRLLFVCLFVSLCLLNCAEFQVSGRIAQRHRLAVAGRIAQRHRLAVAGRIAQRHRLAVADRIAQRHRLAVADRIAQRHRLAVAGPYRTKATLSLQLQFSTNYRSRFTSAVYRSDCRQQGDCPSVRTTQTYSTL